MTRHQLCKIHPKYYLRYGFRSLRPFCEKALRLSRIQAQRIVTEVRRTQTTLDSGKNSKTESLSSNASV